jgi:hypothetical protein
VENRRTAEIVTTAVFLAVTWWMSLPGHRQQEYLMRCARVQQTATLWTARKFGGIGMSDELAGDMTSAALLYRTAYTIMAGPYTRAAGRYRIAGDTTP